MESQPHKLSLKEVLENYSHIQLTEDEVTEAIIWRKIKKEEEIRHKAQQEREEENRKKLTISTTYDLVKSLMLHRVQTKFEGKFILDENNKLIFEILCAYFGQDEKFYSLCKSIGLENISLDKGVLLAGNFGVGKTWFMKLFLQNQRQCYFIRNAKEIADEFQTNGEDSMEDYVKLRQNALNDSSAFFQKYTGLCVDDIGTEDIKVHYGNKKNVIGDIIEKKYANGTTGIYLHGTTNLSAQQLNEMYGGRVVSRMREIFNFIELYGNDRRK